MWKVISELLLELLVFVVTVLLLYFSIKNLIYEKQAWEDDAVYVAMVLVITSLKTNIPKFEL